MEGLLKLAGEIPKLSSTSSDSHQGSEGLAATLSSLSSSSSSDRIHVFDRLSKLSSLHMIRQERRAYKSVFVLAGSCQPPYKGKLYEVEIRQGSEGTGGATHIAKQPVARFFDQEGLLFSRQAVLHGASICSPSTPSKLYMLLNNLPMPLGPPPSMTPDSLKGYVYDTQSMSWGTFRSPKSSKPIGTMIAAYGKLYYLASPACLVYEMPSPPFERYDPGADRWETLPILPSKPVYCEEIVGYAVCCGYILVSLYGSKGFRFMAFHVTREKWYPVKSEVPRRDRCGYPFRGRAVVVGDSIYASSNRCGDVIEFNFNSTTYSVSRPLTLPGLKCHTESVHCDPTRRRTDYFVHLGGSDFCLVQTAMESCRSDCQPLWVTTFRIVVASGGGSYIETLHSTACDVDIGGASFHIRYSFAKDEECDGVGPVEEENGSASDADAEDYGFSPDEDESNSEETSGEDDEDDKDYMK
ncbi:hypothetical protein ACFX12_025751 [Malus domestica]